MGASLRLTNSTFSSRISLSNDSDPANSSHRRQQSVKAPCSSKLAPRSGSQRPATPPQGQSGRMPTASLEKVSASAWKPKEAPRQPRFQARLGKPTTGHPTPRPAWQNANSQPKQVPCCKAPRQAQLGGETNARSRNSLPVGPAARKGHRCICHCLHHRLLPFLSAKAICAMPRPQSGEAP